MARMVLTCRILIFLNLFNTVICIRQKLKKCFTFRISLSVEYLNSIYEYEYEYEYGYSNQEGRCRISFWGR